MHLTDLSVRALKPPDKGQKDYYDDTLPRFGVRLSQSGTRTFFLFVGAKKQRRRQAIGRFPIISLSEARTKAKKILADRTLNGAASTQNITFKEAFDIFEQQKFPKLKPRTRVDYKRILDKSLAKLHDLKLPAIEFDTVIQITDKLVDTPREQFHTLVVAGTFFRWCVRRRYIKHNPIEGVDIPKIAARSRVLTDDELVKVYRGADALEEPFRSIVLLLIICGQRRGETSSLHKTWVSHNEQTITLPPEATKNGREHVIPLGAMALAVIGTATPNDYYFPSGKTNGKQFSGFSKCKRRLDETLKGVAPYTLHDLRRTFSTNLAKIGVLPHVKEALLNHISAKSEVEAIYDRHKYLPEMRQAMFTYETWLTNLLATRPA